MNPIRPLKYLYSSCWEVYQAVIHFFLPHFCLICETTKIESHDLICENCWKNLPLANPPDKIQEELKNKLAGNCYFSKAISLWQFSHETQLIIHYLKYRAFGKIAVKVGELIERKLSENKLISENTLLIPIPLHKTRLRERGYNQSLLLCKAIASETELPYEDYVLKRVRYTGSQTKLNAKQRLENVKNAFVVINQDKILNKTVILVDDVITTGATMNSCARVIRESGAYDVFLLSAIKA